MGELSKHCEEQKQLGAEGCDPCQRGMGTGRRISQSQESRGLGCLPCPLQGVEAACAPMGNSQPLGDQGPPGTTSWAPRAPQQPAARSVISEPRGQGYGEASLCCPRSAEPPSPRPLTGKGREAEAHTRLRLPRQALPRPQLRPWPPPCQGMAEVAGRWVGWGTAVPPTDSYSPRGGCTAAARGAGGWESLARPPARSCDPRSLRGVWVPLPCPQ